MAALPAIHQLYRRLTQQPQRGLREDVRLRQHRGTGLHQNVVAGESSALLSHVNVLDATARRLDVFARNRQLLLSHVQALNVCPHSGSHVG